MSGSDESIWEYSFVLTLKSDWKPGKFVLGDIVVRGDENWNVEFWLDGDAKFRLGDVGIVSSEVWGGGIWLHCDKKDMGKVLEEGWVGGHRLGSCDMIRLSDLGIMGEGGWNEVTKLREDDRFMLGDVCIVGEGGWTGEIRLGVINRSRLGDVETTGEEGGGGIGLDQWFSNYFKIFCMAVSLQSFRWLWTLLK